MTYVLLLSWSTALPSSSLNMVSTSLGVSTPSESLSYRSNANTSVEGEEKKVKKVSVEVGLERGI